MSRRNECEERWSSAEVFYVMIGWLLAVIAIAMVLSSCTIAPALPPVAAAPLPDGDTLDAGIYWNAANHRLQARQFYVDRYAWLVRTYGLRTIPPVTDATRGLTRLPDGEYAPTIEVTTNFQRLDRLSKAAP